MGGGGFRLSLATVRCSFVRSALRSSSPQPSGGALRCSWQSAFPRELLTPGSSRLRHRLTLPGRSPTCESRFSASGPHRSPGRHSPEAVKPDHRKDTKNAPFYSTFQSSPPGFSLACQRKSGSVQINRQPFQAFLPRAVFHAPT
jgi:hypothetical protein